MFCLLCANCITWIAVVETSTQQASEAGGSSSCIPATPRDGPRGATSFLTPSVRTRNLLLGDITNTAHSR